MWDYLLNIIAICLGILLIIYVIHNVGLKKITEAQSLPWILCGFITILLGFAPGIIKALSGILGIWYPPTIIYIIGIAMLVLITLHHAITISKLSNELTELAMIVSLLRHENDKMKDLIKEMNENNVKTVQESSSLSTDVGATDIGEKIL